MAKIVTRPIFRHATPIAKELVFHTKINARTYLSLKPMLIQHANPYDESVHAAQNNFQGGYRQTIQLLSPAAFGRAEVDGDHLGILYTPKPNWRGHDSFSYRLVNFMGQESEAHCIHVFVGL